MSEEAVRVISFLPAATEIVASLGMLDALLGGRCVRIVFGR